MTLIDNLASLRKEALEFFSRENALKFGEFTLKSGRKSPYFFNTGALCSGRQLAEMGRLYASLLALTPAFNDATVIFGSAYKGIPIANATAIAMSDTERGDIRAVSDRKEAKTHGDVSGFLGQISAGDRAVIVDDVITTGETKMEALEKLRQIGCEPLGLIIAMDRAEPVTADGQTALQVFSEKAGIPVYPLLSVYDIAEHRVDLAEIINKYIGETEKHLTELAAKENG